MFTWLPAPGSRLWTHRVSIFEIQRRLKQETKAAGEPWDFTAKCAIHPAQVATINEVLTPTEQQVAKAPEILVVKRQGVGSVDGPMIDEAVARKATLVLERAGVTTQE